MPREAGPLLVVLGAVVVLAGLLAWSGGLGWLGRLPGDLRFEGADGRVRILIPLTSMLLVSVTASLVLAVVRRILGP